MQSFKQLVSNINNKNVNEDSATKMVKAFAEAINKQEPNYSEFCMAIYDAAEDKSSKRADLIVAIKQAVLNNLTFNESEKKKYLSFLSITTKIAREGWTAPTRASAGIASAITTFAWADKKKTSKSSGGVINEFLGGSNTGATADKGKTKKRS